MRAEATPKMAAAEITFIAISSERGMRDTRPPRYRVPSRNFLARE
jgi:hypothetical protein